MAPPAACAVRRSPERGRHSRLVVNQAVLAERNPGAVAAVGAWIEAAERGGSSRALVSAEEVEEAIIRYQQEKEQRLIRFQGEVKRRVNQNAKQQKRHQLQKSYDALAREGLVVKQSSDAAMPFTPKRNTCTYRNTQVAIGSPRVRCVSAQKIGGDEEEADENGNRLFKEHSKTLKETMRQVRKRLAALKTVESEELTLPGGLWKVSPTRDNPFSRRSPVLYQPRTEEERPLLRGFHDLPVELLVPGPEGQTESRMGAGKPICNRLMKASYPAGQAPAYNTDYRATLVLRPGADEEENRKQRQNQFLMYRRLFMDIEREQVKEMRRQKEHNRKIFKMKQERETERLLEEERLRTAAQPSLENLTFEVELMKEQERNMEHRERAQKTREYNRYVEALRAQMKDKMLLHNVELPPLCCCGSDFWDAHPDTCANNCIFYRNPKAYTRALQSVLSSRDTWDGGASSRFRIL
ncbi:PREDICTED: coiled-coil domain-containing protein 15 isoform X1 [Nanorana parkeri]|uniref:coiled-coil domain-containing protein 15 isoform X1 n=1 Tax=Nanorana parkeri TaxID=125878 RepID=UPI000854250F|nr:PREDICTED: coiled-coil domain-containing protein 15 isoform X1 [Nanorana parkeri]